MNDDPQFTIPDNAFEAKKWISALSAELSRQNIPFRDAPEEPTSCCGRGCNGCVWDGYLHAVGYWCDQARELLLRHD